MIGPRFGLLAASVGSSMFSSVAGAFEYASLPADNLIQNAWFQETCQWSNAGWETWPSVSWGLSDKKQDPTDVDCDGVWWGFAARWARNNGATPEFHPNQDALMWQVVGPTGPSDTTLSFHFLFVAHRFNRLKAEIYGGDTPGGPWSSVWIPLDKGWLDPGGASGRYAGQCAGGPHDRNCWWDLTTEAELGSLAPLTKTLSQGYAYYRIEFLGNYPTPSSEPTGDVGGKIARVYFKTSGGLPDAGVTDAGAPADAGSVDGGAPADAGQTPDSGRSRDAR